MGGIKKTFYLLSLLILNSVYSQLCVKDAANSWQLDTDNLVLIETKHVLHKKFLALYGRGNQIPQVYNAGNYSNLFENINDRWTLNASQKISSNFKQALLSFVNDGLDRDQREETRTVDEALDSLMSVNNYTAQAFAINRHPLVLIEQYRSKDAEAKEYYKVKYYDVNPFNIGKIQSRSAFYQMSVYDNDLQAREVAVLSTGHVIRCSQSSGSQIDSDDYFDFAKHLYLTHIDYYRKLGEATGTFGGQARIGRVGIIPVVEKIVGSHIVYDFEASRIVYSDLGFQSTIKGKVSLYFRNGVYDGYTVLYD